MKHNLLGAAIRTLISQAPRAALRNELSPEASQLLAAINKQTDEVKNMALDAQKQAKATGDLTDSLKKSVDEALGVQASLKAELAALSQTIAEAASTAGKGPQTDQSLGAQVVASDAVKAYAASGGRSSPAVVHLQNAVTSGDSSAGPLLTPMIRPGIIPAATQPLRIRDLLAWGRTSQNAIQYFKELAFTNNANYQTSELTTKPQSDITFESDTASVATIAHWILASKQILDDMPQLQGYINGRLVYGLKLKEEGQLLKGAGASGAIEGMMVAGTPYADQGVSVVSENRIDRLRLAILMAELTGYSADGIVLHPTDWVNIELLKTAADKDYLVGNPFGQLTPVLWGRPVVTSTSMDPGEYLVGAFGVAAQGWDREDATVTVGWQGQQFVQNALTILCEERVALATYLPEALITGSFGSL